MERIQAIAARVLISAVLFFNTQAGIVFLLAPRNYSSGFGLDGPVGDGVIRGMGILFLMWTVPYWFAVINPIRFRVSLLEAVAMQTLGLVGESLLLANFQAGYPQINSSLLRFIIFDGAGLAALLLALALTWRLGRQTSCAQ